MLDTYTYSQTPEEYKNPGTLREELLARERRLPQIVFDVETSSLHQMDHSFPALNGRSFTQWLDYLADNGNLRILEIGGGINQKAAREILERHPDTHYRAIEPRPLTDEAATALSRYANYEHLQTGVSSLESGLHQTSYDIVFAHFVAEHLPDPVELVKTASELVEPNRLLFCNRIPLYQEQFPRLISATKQQGAIVAHSEFFPNNSFLKAGIIKGNLAIQRGEQPILYQYQVGQPLRDYHGQQLATREIFFPKAA